MTSLRLDCYETEPSQIAVWVQIPVNSNYLFTLTKLEVDHRPVIALAFQRRFLLPLLDHHRLHVVFLPSPNSKLVHLVGPYRQIGGEFWA